MDTICIFYFCIALCYEKHKLYFFSLEGFLINAKVPYHVVPVIENFVKINFRVFLFIMQLLKIFRMLFLPRNLIASRIQFFWWKRVNMQLGLKSLKSYATEGSVKLILSDLQSDIFQIIYWKLIFCLSHVPLPGCIYLLLHLNVI